MTQHRRFQGYADARRTSRTLLASEPRLGRRFMKGEPNRSTAVASDTIKTRLISDLGPRGYESLLQKLNEMAVERPKRKRRRRRKKVAS